MGDGKKGGARKGAGRLPTGSRTRHYTVNLTIEEADLLEKNALEMGMSINKYLRHLIRKGSMYENVGLSPMLSGYVDEVISEKSWVKVEDGHEVHCTETRVRRHSPEGSADNEREE